MAFAPTAVASAAQTIWFEGTTYDGANKYSSVRSSLIGGRTAIIDSWFHKPRVRTLTSSYAVLYTKYGQFSGGFVEMTHSRVYNVRSSCNYVPYGGVVYSQAYLICKYTY